jgi:transcriptional regulator with XRE-family HTH domain
VSRIEAGRAEPCLGTLGLLAKAFDLSLSELLKGVQSSGQCWRVSKRKWVCGNLAEDCQPTAQGAKRLCAKCHSVALNVL